MKKTLALVVAGLALHSASALAVNINGIWKGSGKVSSNAGGSTPCESMEVAIVHTAAVLNVSTKFKCGGDTLSSPGGNLELKGSEIWSKGRKIGTISANSVVISAEDAERTLATTCNFTDKEMTFRTITSSASDPGLVITFDGKVSR